MDRREQRFKKCTSVTKEVPYTAATTHTTNKITTVTLTNFPLCLRRSDNEPRSLLVQCKKQQWSSATLRGRGASERRRARCASRSEGSLLLSDVPSVHAKMAKYALLTAARAEVPDHTAHAEGSDTTPT